MSRQCYYDSSMIYQPAGRAKEYCELAVNLYVGCGHGCTYCYAPSATFKTKEQFLKPYPKPNLTQRLETESKKYRGKEIFLCFACDAYQPIEEKIGITRQAIEILQENNCVVNILTKGGKRSERDFDLLSKKQSKYGVTLTFLDNNDSLKYEPSAALPSERIEVLKKAHELGIFTWVSLEPVIDPKQTIGIVEKTKGFVDMFKVGKWNYDTMASKIDWHKFVHEIIKIFNANQLKYYIKKDLLKFIQ